MYSTDPATDAVRHYEPIFARDAEVESARAIARADFLRGVLRDDLDSKPAWCCRAITYYVRPVVHDRKPWVDRQGSIVENVASFMDSDTYADDERVAIARVVVEAAKKRIPGALEIIIKAADRFADHEADCVADEYEG